jgi:hypothetical protein
MNLKLLLIFIFILPVRLVAQQFSFEMRFADAAGNKDTITLGYDVNGSNAIDAAFGEQNINGQAWKTGLDVRAGNRWWKEHASKQAHLQGKDAFVDAFINAQPMQSKKQIVKHTGDCKLGSVWTGDYWKIVPIIELDINTAHWPVTASWDSKAFDNDCRKGSVFTARYPGGWWDTDYTKFKAEMLQQNSVTFYDNTHGYTEGSGKIPVYWLAIADSSLTFDDLEMEWLLSLSVTDIITAAAPQIYPNPADDRITITTSAALQEARIYTLQGQLAIRSNSAVIDVSNLSSGIYMVEVLCKNGGRQMTRLVKE